MTPEIIKTCLISAADFKHDDCVIFFQVHKPDVNNNSFARINHFMNVCKQAKCNARGKVGLAFAYDDDPRELYDIPEVCNYIDALFAAHPHILYFLAPDVDAVRAFVLSIMRCSLPTDNGQSSIDADFIVFKAIVSKHVDAAISYAATINDIAGARELLSYLEDFM